MSVRRRARTSEVRRRRRALAALLETRGPAKGRHPHCSPKLRRNEVGSFATERDESFGIGPAHPEPLQDRRIRLDGPSADGFEHLVHPIWDIHPFGHQPDYAGAKRTAFGQRHTKTRARTYRGWRSSVDQQGC